MRTISVSIFPERDGSYFAEPPGWTGCYAEGNTLGEVKANVREAVAAYLGAQPDSFELSFEMRTHELRDVPEEDMELDPKIYTDLDELLRDLKAGL